MKTLVTTILLTVSIAFGVYLFSAKEAKCAWCPSYPCYGNGHCGYGCSCMKQAGDLSGTCVSFGLVNGK